MEIVKTVDLETLTEEEKALIESGEKTAEDLLAEYEETETANKTAVEDKIKKAEELANNYKIRAEKAEAQSKEKKDITPTTDDTLSQKDLLVLVKSDITEEEDIDEVRAYAQLKNISVSDAIKSNIIKTILKEKKEERATAEATNTGGGKRSPRSPSGKELLNKAKNSGEIPETDEEIESLVNARMGL